MTMQTRDQRDYNVEPERDLSLTNRDRTQLRRIRKSAKQEAEVLEEQSAVETEAVDLNPAHDPLITPRQMKLVVASDEFRKQLAKEPCAERAFRIALDNLMATTEKGHGGAIAICSNLLCIGEVIERSRTHIEGRTRAVLPYFEQATHAVSMELRRGALPLQALERYLLCVSYCDLALPKKIQRDLASQHDELVAGASTQNLARVTYALNRCRYASRPLLTTTAERIIQDIDRRDESLLDVVTTYYGVANLKGDRAFREIPQLYRLNTYLRQNVNLFGDSEVISVATAAAILRNDPAGKKLLSELLDSDAAIQSRNGIPRRLELFEAYVRNTPILPHISDLGEKPTSELEVMLQRIVDAEMKGQSIPFLIQNNCRVFDFEIDLLVSCGDKKLMLEVGYAPYHTILNDAGERYLLPYDSLRTELFNFVGFSVVNLRVLKPYGSSTHKALWQVVSDELIRWLESDRPITSNRVCVY